MGAKAIKTVKRFVVGWGRKNGRIVFFVQHRKIRDGAIIPTNPDKLVQRLTEFARQIDGDTP